MADKIEMTRNVFVGGELFAAKEVKTVGKDVDRKTAVYLMRIGKAVPAGAQAKDKGSDKDKDKK